MLVFTEVHYKGYLLVRDIIGMCRNVGLASSCRTAAFQVLNALSARGLSLKMRRNQMIRGRAGRNHERQQARHRHWNRQKEFTVKPIFALIKRTLSDCFVHINPAFLQGYCYPRRNQIVYSNSMSRIVVYREILISQIIRQFTTAVDSNLRESGISECIASNDQNTFRNCQFC